MGWGNYAHFTREIQGKDLTVMTVDATILTARHGTARHGTARHGTARHGTARHNQSINQSINQSVVSLRYFVKPFLQNSIGNRETMMLNDTGEMCL